MSEVNPDIAASFSESNSVTFDSRFVIEPFTPEELDEYEREYIKYYLSKKNWEVHYCGEPSCIGDCGVLVCGCIDVCRTSSSCFDKSKRSLKKKTLKMKKNDGK